MEVCYGEEKGAGFIWGRVSGHADKIGTVLRWVGTQEMVLSGGFS